MNKCNICGEIFKNKNLLSRHLNNHKEYINECLEKIYQLSGQCYYTHKIIEQLNLPFGRKWVETKIKENKILVNQYLKNFKEQLVFLFKNGYSIREIKEKYNQLSEHKISEYLHELLDIEEFNKIFKDRKNKKISDSLKGKENHNKYNNKICLYCNKIFYPKKNTQIYCCRSCARKNIETSEEAKLKMSLKKKEMYANGNHKQGGGNAKWYDYKNIKIQGTYELRVCKILDKMKELNEIKNWEYTKDRVKYVGVDNTEHSYLLDFKVFNNDDSFYYIEVKGYKKENDPLKWKATKDQGYKLEVWFNKNIKEKEKLLNL